MSATTDPAPSPRIDLAIAASADVAAWERFWIDLLAEYEAVCADLAEHAEVRPS